MEMDYKFTNWAAEPNNIGGEQAIAMYNNGTWNDDEIKTQEGIF